MAENYDLLGKFGSLSSVKVMKKLAREPAQPKNNSETEVHGLDDILNNKNIITLGKRKDSTNSKGDSQSPKVLKSPESNKLDSITENQSDQSGGEQSLFTSMRSISSIPSIASILAAPSTRSVQPVARRTRQSLQKDSAEAIPETQPLPTRTRKQTKKNNNNSANASCSSSASTSSSTSSTTSSVSNVSTRGRGRRRGRGNLTASASRRPNYNVAEIQEMIAMERMLEMEQANQNAIMNAIAEANGRSFGVLSGIPQNRNVMRARRDCIAEMAARCPTVDVVDLISSPFPRVEGEIDITLDSDEEENRPNVASKPASSTTNHDASFDEENPEMSVKIMWNGKLEHFSLRKYQKFDEVFEKLSERYKLEKSNILLNLENKVISQNDTPSSINYKFIQFIYGRPMMDSNFKGASSLGKKKRDPNLVKLKVQSDKWKKPIVMEMQKTETFKKLIIKCAEELKMPYEKIRLRFDGEPLQYDETPTDLEFEGGEVLEIYFND